MQNNAVTPKHYLKKNIFIKFSSGLDHIHSDLYVLMFNVGLVHKFWVHLIVHKIIFT